MDANPRSKANLDMNYGSDADLETLVENFSAVFGKLMGHATTDWIAVDISLAQVKVLMVLNYLGVHTIHQLAERLQIGAPTASQLVEKLVQAGFATRRESVSDRRVVEVHLTEQGTALVNKLSGARQRTITEWLVELSPEQRQALDASLKALLAIIENSPQ